MFLLLFFSRKNPFGMLIALDDNGQASGQLFWDDGDGIGKVYLYNNLVFCTLS